MFHYRTLHLNLLILFCVSNNILYASGNKRIDWVNVNNIDSLIKVSSKPVILNFDATWCYACHIQSATSFKNKKFANYVNSKFYCISVDVNSTEQLKFQNQLFKPLNDKDKMHSLAKTFRITSVPTIIVLDSNLYEMGRIEGYWPTNQLLKQLKEIESKIKK